MRRTRAVAPPVVLAALVAASLTFGVRGQHAPLAPWAPGPTAPAAGLLPAGAILMPPSAAPSRVDGDPASFTLRLDVDPRAVSRAFLVYELAGLPDWTAAPRSVNGRRAQGGFRARPAGSSGLQVEELQPRWLLRGPNEVRFLPVAEDPTAPAAVTDLRSPERLAGLAAGRPLPYEVRGLRLAVVLEDGRPLIRDRAVHAPAPSRLAGRLVDGDGLTAWAGESDPESRLPKTLDLPLRRAAFPGALELTLTGAPSGTLLVEAVSGDGGSELVGEADLAALGAGRRRLDLAPAYEPAESLRLSWSGADGSTGGISEVELEAAPAAAGAGPRMTLTAVRAAEATPRRSCAYLRGFLEPARDAMGQAELFVDGGHVPGAIAPDGGFELFVPRRGAGAPRRTASAARRWSVRLEVVYPGGDRLEKTVELGGAEDEPGDKAKKKPGSGSGNRREARAKAGERTVVEFEGAKLDIPADALKKDVTITIETLTANGLAAMDQGLTNVTAPILGYRFGPDGLRFEKPIAITLTFGREKVPIGLTTDDVDLYFFDEAGGTWVPLERVAVDAAAGSVTAWTDHFTDFISATLTGPESPSGENFRPDSIQALESAAPGAGITLIGPPEASPTGDARLTYPLELPPGRRGMEPDLALSYDSRGQNGWVGLGWDLPVSSIEVDTRFGVPR